MATKRIQLRGISRTPSDRMTNDGGCAESLNVQLDNTELAPSFYPDDVTTKRGLPADLEADKIFVHKTASYENYIVVQSDKIIAYTPDIDDKEPLEVLTLAEGDEVKDIKSVGNTLIIAATNNLYYALFRFGAYVFLGNKIPFPTIEFFDSITKIARKNEFLDFDLTLPQYENMIVRFGFLNEDSALISEDGAWVVGGVTYYGADGPNSDEENERRDVENNFLKDLWNEVDAHGANTNPYVLKVTQSISDLYEQMRAENQEKGIFTSPIWACYAVRLYDGSLIVSTPQLLSPGCEEPIDLRGWSMGERGRYFIRLNHYYKIGMRMWESNGVLMQQWKDIVKGVEVYISEDINRLDFGGVTIAKRDITNSAPYYGYDSIFVKFKLRGEEKSFINEAVQKSVFCHVESFYIDEAYYAGEAKNIKVLENDIVLDSRKYVKQEDRVMLKKLSEDIYDMKRMSYVTNSLSIYNNQVLLVGSNIQYSESPQWLTSQRSNTYLPIAFVEASSEYLSMYMVDWWEEEIKRSTQTHYEMVFAIRDNISESVKRGNNPYKLIKRNEYVEPSAYSLIMYPSSHAKNVMIIGDNGSKEVEMKIHPTLPDLSFYYEDKPLDDNLDQKKELPVENEGVDRGNCIYVTRQDNPLFVEKSISFQSKVLGVAVATTTLSQGQFGQFPLYVFTEDGIWAMETGADGSFVSQKPLSREVCINPDSITSLDNAVVFVTTQGVMLLQGSMVTNISPFMNGKHYDVEESAKIIINGQKDFKNFIPVIDDETHFLAFVKEAKIAYDYAGKRLIFIKEGEDYQYIYKLDTQTWHKSAYGMNLVTPINSYPECLVMASEEEWVEKKYLKIISFAGSQLDEHDLSDDFLLMFGEHYELTKEQLIEVFTADSYLDITQWTAAHTTQMEGYLETERVEYEIVADSYKSKKVLDLSTILDAAESKTPTKGVIATRPLDFDEPDVLKTITDIRIRGQYRKGAVKFILLGSNDGVTFSAISTLRGKAWKMFRIIILADLQPTERISWIDVQYETRFTNRLR